MLDNKQIWAAHCENHYVPLYFRPWWMDCVCGGADQWDVCLCLDGGGNVQGALIFHSSRYFGMPVIKMPPLTAYSGLWFHEEVQLGLPSSRMAFEKRVCENLLSQLPPHAFFFQQWHPAITNWLPFFWKNYRQTTHYTYILKAENQGFVGEPVTFNRRARRGVKKAAQGIQVEKIVDVKLAYQLHEASRRRQGALPDFSFFQLEKLDAELAKRNQRLMLASKDDSDDVHAIAYLAWDERTTYDLFNGTSPAHRNSQALYLVIWDALKNNYGNTPHFDFEGSMVESVEEFLRSFGGTLTPHFRIFKAKNRLTQLASVLFSKEFY